MVIFNSYVNHFVQSPHVHAVEAQRWPRLHGDDEDDALRRLPAAALRPGEGTLWSALERGHGTKSSDFPS